MPRLKRSTTAPRPAPRAHPVSRRQFLKGTGAAVGLTALGMLPVGAAKAEGSRKAEGQKAVLIDTTRCIGCNLCVEACKRENRQPLYDRWPRDLSPDSYTYVRGARDGTYYAKRQCMSCVDGACVAVCPVGAMRKSKLGPVSYDADRCFGCRYCEMACPFQVPRYEWDEVWPRVTKCNMCRDRVEEGLSPACVEACPFGTLTFGDREEMLAEAHRRIEASPDIYVDHVYGEHEVGGTCVLYLSSIPFEELGLPELPEEALPKHTWDDTVKLPWVMGLGLALLTGAWFVTKERERTETEENRDAVDKEESP